MPTACFAEVTFPIAGQHGHERRAADGSLHRHRPSLSGLARLRRELARFALRHEGLYFEDKGPSLALHYRQAPRLASHVHRTLRAEIAASGGTWQLQSGKRILEVRPEGSDKGSAILAFMAEAPFRGRRPVFVGDDHADERGFEAVDRLGGVAVKVGPGRTGARYRLPNVAAVRRWLTAAAMAADPAARGTRR